MRHIRRAAGLLWALPAILPGAATSQQFGGAVVAADGHVLVGEALSEREPGTVYVFRPDEAGWTEVATLRAPEAAVRDQFGRAMARNGATLFVAAPGGEGGAGVVYVLRQDAGGWVHAGAITRPGVESFGVVLASGGDHLLVGAPDPASGSLGVFAYRRHDGGEWAPSGRLSPPVEAPSDSGFGAALVVSGDLAVVGAPSEDDRAGAAYVFRFVAESGWRLLARLTPPEDDAADAAFGASVAVAVAGPELVIGAPGTDRFRGKVHVFAQGEGGGWSLTASIAGAVEPPAGFGTALATDDDRLLVGAPAVGNGRGEVFAYTRDASGWRLDRALDIATEARVQAGAVIAVGDGLGVLGLPGDEFGAGTALVFENGDGAWEPRARVFSEQGGLPAISGGQIDCAQGAAQGYDCDEVDLLSFVPREALGAARGSRLNDVWGWTDASTGREYAIVGRMDGTAFVDVSDPHNPRYLGDLDKHAGSQANTWRDMKVYADHVFIVADGALDHGMQIFDLRQLRDVTEPREFEETAHYDRIASAHNIVINEESGFAYIVGATGGGETCGGGLHMVDIREPLAPAFAGCFAHENTGRLGTGYSHDAQCVVYHGPDPDYQGREICIGANETALSIADVSEKGMPVAIAMASYPNVGYAHQGWLSQDHRFFYSNDEGDELQGLVDATRTLVWDVTDLDDPTLVKEYFSPTKVTDHNLYVSGTRMYMSNNRSGLRVVDVSDPADPREIGFFDTTPWSEDSAGFDGTWSVYPYFASGVILLSSRREGLFIVRPREQRLVP